MQKELTYSHMYNGGISEKNYTRQHTVNSQQMRQSATQVQYLYSRKLGGNF